MISRSLCCSALVIHVVLCFVHVASNERINIFHIFLLWQLLLLLSFSLFLTLRFTNFTMLSYYFIIPFCLHLLLLLNIFVSSTAHTIVVWFAPSIFASLFASNIIHTHTHTLAHTYVERHIQRFPVYSFLFGFPFSFPLMILHSVHSFASAKHASFDNYHSKRAVFQLYEMEAKWANERKK